MGFKADTSFLRFVTMGATGARRTMALLRAAGFAPIELERYATSNKIWATKIKRLRLPDLLCVRTGLRVEVRTKSDLTVKMSDAPDNPDRVWHAGLRDDDVIAFIACREADGVMRAADAANFFPVGALKAAEPLSKLGQPKSASEGSERDRAWPAYVPALDGRVTEIRGGGLLGGPPTHIRMVLHEGGRPPRPYTYALRGKHAYVREGDRFSGGETVIAGVAAAKAELTPYLARAYDPLADLAAAREVDRYAAVKALPHRAELAAAARPRLEALVREERDGRIQLEAAGSAAALGSRAGIAFLEAVAAAGEGAPELRMEAVFILAESRTDAAADLLTRVAADRTAPSELRQAAVWGLGFAGHERYDRLLAFLADGDADVALHAMAAFGPGAPPDVVQALVSRLDERDPATAAGASEALRLVGGDVAVVAAADAVADPARRDWALATLGRLDPGRVRALVQDAGVLRAVAPMLRLFSAENWLATGDRPSSLAYLLGQRLADT